MSRCNCKVKITFLAAVTRQLWAHTDNVPWQFNMTNGVSSSSQGIVLIFKSSSFTVCANVASLWCCSHLHIHDSQLSFLEFTIVTGPVGGRGVSSVEGSSNKQARWSLGGVLTASCQHYPHTCTHT